MAHSISVDEYVRKIQALLDGYFALFPADKDRLSVLREQVTLGEPELCNRKTLPGHLTGSALVLQLPKQSALLIKHNFLQRWLQPGGHLDPFELPVQGARRELYEEVGGLSATLHPWHETTGSPLDIDSHVIPANASKLEPDHLHHDWLYLFLLDSGKDFNLQEEEVSGFSWIPLSDLSIGNYGKRLMRVYKKAVELKLFDG